MGLKQIKHEKYGVNDLVRITARKSMHGFEVGKIVAITGAAQRESDGSIMLGAIDETGRVWSVIEDEIEMYEKYDPAIADALIAGRKHFSHVH